MTEVTDRDAKQPVGVFDFVNTDGMLRMGDNRYIPVEKNGQVRFGTGTVRQGVLEASNADLAEQMTKVIEAQRSFSYNLRMVTVSDEIETTVNNLRS
ncbi:Flagellar hook protein FlgE [bioreactor metagenome]|uniref:Flagellar hook protein FlgE n=1 Tax=bioreactor metagenome TaxID=1076179 RepID=A0A645CF92_9ZZZZ